MLTPVLQRVTVSGCDGTIVCVLLKVIQQSCSRSEYIVYSD